MSREPEYKAIMRDPGFGKYTNCCPNCHRYPGEKIGPGQMRFPCGSVFDLETGTADKRCEPVVMDTEGALFEAASMHYMFCESPHQFLDDPDRERQTIPHLSGPPSFLDGSLPVQYLLWDTEILFSVIDNHAQAIGTIPEWHGDMNMVWVANRDVYQNDFIVLGWFVHADKKAAVYGQIIQIKGNQYGEPVVLWHTPFYWGNPLESNENAALYLVYSWLHQPYVGMTDGIHRPRHERRRAEREGRTLGNIKLIEFRKPQGNFVQSAPSNGPKRELHCCFERTGFSKRQHYGPKNSLRKIQWIAPTLVGDPSKPFKPRGQTLYRVTR